MGLLRPDVVWFGESLPEPEMAMAQAAAEQAETCLVIGTQGAVYPAAGLVYLARSAGASVIVVDPGKTAFDDVADVKLTGPAGELIPRLLGPHGGP
jgi:NAD-dependent deacetylase